jgi:hypothetical protein
MVRFPPDEEVWVHGTVTTSLELSTVPLGECPIWAKSIVRSL